MDELTHELSGVCKTLTRCQLVPGIFHRIAVLPMEISYYVRVDCCVRGVRWQRTLRSTLNSVCFLSCAMHHALLIWCHARAHDA